MHFFREMAMRFIGGVVLWITQFDEIYIFWNVCKYKIVSIDFFIENFQIEKIGLKNFVKSLRSQNCRVLTNFLSTYFKVQKNRTEEFFPSNYWITIFCHLSSFLFALFFLQFHNITFKEYIFTKVFKEGYAMEWWKWSLFCKSCAYLCRTMRLGLKEPEK